MAPKPTARPCPSSRARLFSAVTSYAAECSCTLGQVVLRRELRLTVADDGGPSWIQLQHGKRTATGSAQRGAEGATNELCDEVLLSRSELGLAPGAYAWDATARY